MRAVEVDIAADRNRAGGVTWKGNTARFGNEIRYLTVSREPDVVYAKPTLRDRDHDRVVAPASSCNPDTAILLRSCRLLVALLPTEPPKARLSALACSRHRLPSVVPHLSHACSPGNP